MNHFYSTIFICIVIQNVIAVPRIDPLVETELGFIRGLTSDDGTYSMFMGIPYAYVNRSNPFGPAIPNTGFHNTFDAYDDSAYCPQFDDFSNEIRGTLECLNLNVYVPQSANSRSPLPVQIWIHGGGFRFGFAGRSIYGPSYLVKHNIIVVTINYRLGPYGFICLNTPEVPGNQGLKDQKLALKWIKDNIAAFGGDADKITISGESAGAGSVDFHLLYSQERLFDKVILQSGNAQGPWAVQKPDTEAPLKISEHLGFDTNDLNEALNFLSTVDPHILIAASAELELNLYPCIEQDFNGQQFITEHPRNKNVHSLRNIPILIGVTSREAVLDYDVFTTNLENNRDNFVHEFIQQNLKKEFQFTDEESVAMEKLIRNLYMGDENYNDKSIWSLIDFNSDFYFNHPVVRAIKKYLDSGARNVFQYMFSYVGGRSYQYYAQNGLNSSDGDVGAGHFDEIGYLFEMTDYFETPNDQDQLMIDRITTLWANFVKYGNPTPETSDLIPVSWPPVTQDTLPYMDINNDLTVNSRFFRERMTFWDLFYRLNKNAIFGYNPEDK